MSSKTYIILASTLWFYRGYRGHVETDTQVFLSGQMRKVTPTIKKELKRRSAIEAVIGHQKTEGRLGWNRLRGILGDKINALMAAIGYNLRLILRALSFLLQILKELIATITGRLDQLAKYAITSALNSSFGTIDEFDTKLYSTGVSKCLTHSAVDL